ncbi:MAG: glutathione S-transferase [Gammaproteobacteria bacterium]|nr:glutathione S-transferase [Gammaproteobacteria bacterium]MDH5260703.1 glutathione S-transferase [Gammaproteobacteria bacterium]MDH5584209.1 glutathione S-transferase [Gammaproteobacteria bacterium]
MKLYWAPQTRSTRAIWMLEEAGVPYETELVDIRAADRHDSAAFRSASPMGKVPAIIDGDVAMSESAAICIYVADRYAPGTLAPALDDPLRGKFLYWTLYTPAVVEPAMSEKFNKVASNRVRSGWGDFDAMIETFDRALDGKEWIVGDRFTAADVMLGSSAVFMRMFEMLPDSSNLGAYADRCLARPAYAKAMSMSAA